MKYREFQSSDGCEMLDAVISLDPLFLKKQVRRRGTVHQTPVPAQAPSPIRCLPATAPPTTRFWSCTADQVGRQPDDSSLASAPARASPRVQDRDARVRRTAPLSITPAGGPARAAQVTCLAVFGPVET